MNALDLNFTQPLVLPTDAERTATRDKAIAATIASPTRELQVTDYAKMAESHLQIADQRLVHIMTTYGIVDPWDCLHAARHENADLAICCTSLNMESYGGRNEWGADPGGSALLLEYRNTLVTKPVFLGSYWPRVLEGFITNGCGPTQLTDKALQLEAQHRGGCYLPLHNETTGFNFMKELINQSGSIWLGFYHYNGSGAAATAYANKAVALYSQWKARGL